MRNELRKIVYIALGGIDRFLKNENKIVILCYHSISDDGWKFSVPMAEFKKQMKYLVSKRTPIKLADLEKYLKGEMEIKNPVFILTFDDGYHDLIDVRSFLKSINIKPCAFLIADDKNVDRSELETDKRLLTKKDIKLLIADGWEIGCHSLTHTNIRKLNKQKLIREIINSKKELTNKYDREIEYFSYPKGYYTKDIEKTVADSGYKLAVSMDAKIINSDTSLYTVPREGVDGSHSFVEFKSLFSPSVVRFKRTVKDLAKEFI